MVFQTCPEKPIRKIVFESKWWMVTANDKIVALIPHMLMTQHQVLFIFIREYEGETIDVSVVEELPQ